MQNNSLHFSKHIAAKYTIFRKSGRLPALIFLKLFGTRVVNKITNINRRDSINNHYRLYFNIYLKMISQLESILIHSKKSNIQTVTNTASLHESYFKNTLLFLMNIFQFSHAKKPIKTALYNESHRLISNLQKSANSFIEQGSYKIANNVMNVILSEAKNFLIVNLQETLYFVPGDKMRYFTTTSGHKDSLSNRAIPLQPYQKDNLWGHQPATEQKLSAILLQVNPLVSNRILFSTNKSLYNVTFRRTLVGQASRQSQNANQCDNPTTSRRTSFKMGMDDFYFHNQLRIEQEVEEIKKIVVKTKEATEEKSLCAHSLKDDIDKQIKQYLDINRISDQVYQNIERRIRIEKERRGL